jgi:anti-sigma B factor antagonist
VSINNPDPVAVTLTKRGDIAVLFVAGRLDRTSAPILARALGRVWGQPFAGLWVDLSGAGEIDSAGLQLLLDARRRTLEQGREFVIRSPSSEATRVIERSGLWESLTGVNT